MSARRAAAWSATSSGRVAPVLPGRQTALCIGWNARLLNVGHVEARQAVTAMAAHRKNPAEGHRGRAGDEGSDGHQGSAPLDPAFARRRLLVTGAGSHIGISQSIEASGRAGAAREATVLVPPTKGRLHPAQAAEGASDVERAPNRVHAKPVGEISSVRRGKGACKPQAATGLSLAHACCAPWSDCVGGHVTEREPRSWPRSPRPTCRRVPGCSTTPESGRLASYTRRQEIERALARRVESSRAHAGIDRTEPDHGGRQYRRFLGPRNFGETVFKTTRGGEAIARSLRLRNLGASHRRIHRHGSGSTRRGWRFRRRSRATARA